MSPRPLPKIRAQPQVRACSPTRRLAPDIPAETRRAAAVDADGERGRGPRLGFMLVMPSSAMSDTGCRTGQRRATRPGTPGRRAGRCLPGTRNTRMVRISSRPCPRSFMTCWTGTFSQGRASRASNKPGWLSLTQESDKPRRFRALLPCEVVVTAVTHPLHGCRRRAYALRHADSLPHLKVRLLDGPTAGGPGSGGSPLMCPVRDRWWRARA